ncbi:MAG: D-alanyl-D-alanine dipeptidase [Verrucomicrobia bacterium]|nr:D-alanyl-D-alanine dipeptidase [Verrucomicrobiota bacterium]
MEWIDLTAFCPDILIELVYATEKNFTGKKIYPTSRCFLQKVCAERLKKVQKKLVKGGLSLKVLDAYRPLSVQKIFWNILPDPRYVADPAVGSKHNRGCAVDVTLVDKRGNELLMPTLFDDFTEKAHRNWMGGSKEALKNRQILEEAMVAEGFIPFPTEWWHFDDPDWKNYPVSDFSLEEIR